MSVSQRIPLTETDDGVQRVVLQDEGAAGGDPGRPIGQRRGLVWVVHHAETVDDQIRGFTVCDRCEPALRQKAEPRATMGTRELDDTVSTGEPSGRREALYGVGRLGNECFWLRTSRLRGHGWAGQAAAPDRMQRRATSAAGDRDRGRGLRQSGN